MKAFHAHRWADAYEHLAGECLVRRSEILRLQEDWLDALEEARREAAIRRVVEEAPTPAQRSKVLPAYVEIMLAAGDAEAARVGSEML